MSATVIPFEKKYLNEVKEIFFESSTKKDFKDLTEKEAFFEKYLGFYLREFPEFALLATNGKILGYVVGAPESDGPQLSALQPHLKIFAAYFEKYPAHLHVNCHHEARGLGVGSQLIRELEKKLKLQNVRGLHIMTGPDAPNKFFYKKLGFDFESELAFKGSPILFMGKRLSDN